MIFKYKPVLYIGNNFATVNKLSKLGIVFTNKRICGFTYIYSRNYIATLY